jgi:hypothetical protein
VPCPTVRHTDFSENTTQCDANLSTARMPPLTPVRSLERHSRSMADHPRPASWKTAFGRGLPCRGGRSRRRASAISALTTGSRNPWRMRAPLVGRQGRAPCRIHRREMRGRDRHPRRRSTAIRARLGGLELRHRPECLEWAALRTVVFVERHGRAYLSGDNGTSTSPLRYFVGPAAFGRISKSKISVGRYSVAQALGISTTPLI